MLLTRPYISDIPQKYIPLEQQVSSGDRRARSTSWAEAVRQEIRIPQSVIQLRSSNRFDEHYRTIVAILTSISDKHKKGLTILILSRPEVSKPFHFVPDASNPDLIEQSRKEINADNWAGLPASHSGMAVRLGTH